MKKLGRPISAIKRITVSSHIRQDAFVILAKKASKMKISISKLLSDIIEKSIIENQ